LRTLSEPARQRRLRQGLYLFAAIWLVFGLADLFWSLVPQPRGGAQPDDIVNPLVERAQQSATAAIDIDELVQWNLFGTAATPPAQVVEEPEEIAAGSGNLDGIEDGARETRLALTLQGILGSSDAEQARAIIEAKKEQQQYLVGDELPVGNKVKLAKILADRVVIDNSGKYELLLLFGEDELAANVSAAPSARDTAPVQRVDRAEQARAMDRRGSSRVSEMAENYRQRLYSNPQSLAQVVRIAAVREAGQLKGYRVSAGRDREQFEALGFKANDIVTGVNGIELTDPGKAIKLYEVMRTAREASFNVLRDGEQVTLTVGLENGGPAEGPEDD
jgi:general secretion pathway protein C